METIHSAAIRVNGKTVEAELHSLAVVKAGEMGLLPGLYMGPWGSNLDDYNIEIGFTTSSGRFVDRKEAETISQAASQQKTSPWRQSPGELHSVDLKGVNILRVKEAVAVAKIINLVLS